MISMVPAVTLREPFGVMIDRCRVVGRQPSAPSRRVLIVERSFYPGKEASGSVELGPRGRAPATIPRRGTGEDCMIELVVCP